MVFVLGRTAPNRCVHRTPYLAPAPMLCYRPSVWEGPVLPCVRFVALNKSSQVKVIPLTVNELVLGGVMSFYLWKETMSDHLLHLGCVLWIINLHP